MIRGVIFDVDGTLLDSNPIWDTAAERYLNSLGIAAEPGLGELLFPMSLEEGAAYIKEKYGLTSAIEEIVGKVTEVVEDLYIFEAPLKNGVRELLQWMSEQGIKMAVATSGDRRLVEAAFDRNGISHYFEIILTCTEVGASKSKPDIYLMAAQLIGSEPSDTLVIEDAYYAVKTAKEAGFFVAGVYDKSNDGQAAAIRKLCDIYCERIDSVKTPDRLQFCGGSDGNENGADNCRQ